MPEADIQIVDPFDRDGTIDITVEFSVEEAEPDVGVSSWTLGDWEIVDTSSVYNVDAIEQAMTAEDKEALETAIYANFEPDSIAEY